MISPERGVAGSPVMIGDAAIVGPEGDASAIAGALRSPAEDAGLRARLVAAGRRRRVEEHLSVAAQVERLKELFRTA